MLPAFLTRFFIPRISSRFLPHASRMSYQTYTTEAIVVGSFISNTADKSYLLFTKEAGLLYATARSVREERSLQRHALQDFSHITVSLIKGKSGWRIGSVSGETNYFSITNSRSARGSVVRVVKLIRRYIQGEEPHPELFVEFATALTIIGQDDIVNRPLVEEIITTRLLNTLGYIDEPTLQKTVFRGTLQEAIAVVPVETFPTLVLINKTAAQASQL